jgi:hypothetical protein
VIEPGAVHLTLEEIAIYRRQTGTLGRGRRVCHAALRAYRVH